MSDEKILNELALNRREITHDVWGSFIIRRPTNAIQSRVATAVTRAYNRDLQTKERVSDPENPGEFKLIPAFLTKKLKMQLLEEHGDWTDEDKEALDLVEGDYRKACFELDNAGYVGFGSMIREYDDLTDSLESFIGKKKASLAKELETVFPASSGTGTETFEGPSVEEFVSARDAIQKATKNLEVLPILDRLTELHKQYTLFLEGAKAQSDLFEIKLREITLFTDTVEARAEKEGQLTKIFECVWTEEEDESPWKNLFACEEEDPDKLAWLLQEVEKFERLDPGEDEDDERKYRFNFLFPLGVTSTLLDDSHAQRESSTDGESPQEAQNTSTEDLDTPTES